MCPFFISGFFGAEFSSRYLVHTRNNKMVQVVIFFFVQKIIDKDIDNIYDNNTYDEAKEPEVYMF